MVDVPLWVWQVLAAIVGGLGLGVGLGAVVQRRKKRSGKAAPAEPAGPQDTLPTQPMRPAESHTPQQRLLERLRESNLQLTAQLRSIGDDHARAMLDKTQEQQAEKFRHEREIEELKHSHSAELSHLMSVLVEQVDGIHKAHANHVKALEAEIDRVRGGKPAATVAGTVSAAAAAAAAAAAPNGAALAAAVAARPAAPRLSLSDHAATEIQSAEFVPTQHMGQDPRS